MNFYEKLNICIVEMSNLLRKIFNVIQEQGDFAEMCSDSYNIQVPQSIAMCLLFHAPVAHLLQAPILTTRCRRCAL